VARVWGEAPLLVQALAHMYSNWTEIYLA